MESLADGTFQGFYLCFSRTQFHDSGHLLQIFPGWKSLFSKWLTETELDPWDRSTNQRCCMEKAVLKSFAIFTGKSLCLSLCLIKLQTFRSGLQVCNFIKKRFQHSCFPVNITKFAKTPTLKNICEQLLLLRPRWLRLSMNLKDCFYLYYHNKLMGMNFSNAILITLVQTFSLLTGW